MNYTNLLVYLLVLIIASVILYFSIPEKEEDEI